MDINFYEKDDITLMPDMVNAANIKHPSLNLKFYENPGIFAKSIKDSISEGDSPSRYIINIGCDGIHFAVIDRRVIDGKISLIVFEPANLNADAPVTLAIRIKRAIDIAKIDNCHLAIAEMDIQKSYSECGIFSLAIAKKLHLKSADLEKLHSDNIEGLFIRPSTPDLGYLTPNTIDKYLPAEFYKHTQSRIRLHKYLKTNPESENKIINKKEQTLLERLIDYSVNLNGREKYFSAHRKRIAEYERLKNSQK